MTTTSSTHTASPIILPDAEATFRLMCRIRYFDDQAYYLYARGLIHGTMHVAVGHEAIVAGVAAALRPDDYSLSTYRGHMHVISRGAPLDACMSELFGRANGLCKGKGGSMHLASVEHGALGSYAIVGAHLPIACGTAWSAKVRGTDQVTACHFGDGATNIGAFHEALNLAAIWKLPVVFVCENNQYMEFTPIAKVTAVPRPAADRAAAYGLPALVVDGNDVEAVYAMARDAVDRARAGDGPSLIEALTYRHYGHSRSDPGRYRPVEEVAAWKARDPVRAFRKRLELNGWRPEGLTAIEQAAKAEVEEATQRAMAAPPPDASELLTDVFCGSKTWRN
jgi:pyruvate dehydrogenase E1 component alpha subunit